MRTLYDPVENNLEKNIIAPNCMLCLLRKEVQKMYLHTIGNLTLTAYNSEMSDKPFIEK